MSNVNIPKNIRELSRERAPEFYKRLTRQQPDQFQRGQIWSTYQSIEMPDGRRFEADEPKLLVILVADKNDLVAAPISLQTEMATEFDLIVQSTDGPLGFGFMIEVWNETPIIIKHLRRYLGALDDEYTELLIELHAAYLCNESVPQRVLPYVGISIRQEDDLRLEFQANEINTVEYLSRAATALASCALLSYSVYYDK